MVKKKSEKKSVIKRFFGAIGGFFAKITAPIRNNKVWKFLRRTILRSPFGGYFVNAFKELKEVTWPNRVTAWKLTFAVFLFSALFAAFLTALDFGFERLAQEIFLK